MINFIVNNVSNTSNLRLNILNLADYSEKLH